MVRPQRITRAAARRRRRLLLAASLVSGVFGCGLLSEALFAGSGGPAAAAPREHAAAVSIAPAPGAVPAVVVAEAGDSLWTIAERFHGETPVVDYVAQLVALNGGAAIRAGDAVVLPV